MRNGEPPMITEATPNLLAWRQLEYDLLQVVSKNKGADSPEEEDIMAQLDNLWYNLLVEHEYINKHKGPYYMDLVRWRIYAENMYSQVQKPYY